MSTKTSPRRAVRMIARQSLADQCRTQRDSLNHAPHGTCSGFGPLASLVYDRCAR